MTHSLENRLSGSLLSRFWQELFRNTGQFPIAILLIEILTEKREYLTKPDMYVLIPSTLLQAYWIALKQERPAWQRFIGNLIAPAVYSLGEIAIEGFVFFDKPHHTAYWIFALLIAVLQALQSGTPSLFSNAILVLENVVRSQILFVGYAIFESYTNPAQTINAADFFSDPSHILIGLATLILGLSAGAADVNARSYLSILQDTAGQLKVYSEWLLGRDLLGRAIKDPNSMTLSNQTRTVMFMDIRGFTAWSEKRSPEEVAALLSEYYLTVEKILDKFQVIKYKFTADEVMAVFIESNESIQAAREIRVKVAEQLWRYDLGAGIGIHTGSLVEGLLGAQKVRFYDVLGDTVNTASRIEKDSQAGELWISEDTRAQIARPVISGEKEIFAKGKELPVKVYLIL